jgi:GGDEF domain-containing protein
MPSTDAILAVVLLAILVNLVLAIALLFAPRLRAAVARRADSAAPKPGPAAAGAVPSAGRLSVGVFRPLPPVAPPTDADTGFDLPITWSRWLDDEDARIRRYRRSATVVFVEVEGLERIVERLGDETMARLVPGVALNLSRHARETDRFARLADARFGVLLAETDEIEAINYVERIRTACDTWLESGGIASRLLIGWSEANSSRSIDAAVQQAEDRLNADRRQPAAINDDDLHQGMRALA